MRRTDSEFKEEVLRRSREYRTRQNRKRKQALTTSMCILVCVVGLYLFWPTAFSAKSADTAAPESMNMAMGSASQMITDQEPAADEPAEAVPEEGGLYGDTAADDSSISRQYDVISIEVTTSPESEKWSFKDMDDIVEIILAIEDFHYTDATAEMMESVGDAEGLAYQITVIRENKTEHYTLFNNGLFSEAEDGWIGVDPELYRTLETLITRNQ